MLDARKDIDFFEKEMFPYKDRKKKNFLFKTKEELEEESEEERFK